MSERRSAVVIRARTGTGADGAFSHPYNPKSEITGVQLGREAGLTRTGISLGRIAPGRESFVLHATGTRRNGFTCSRVAARW